MQCTIASESCAVQNRLFRESVSEIVIRGADKPKLSTKMSFIINNDTLQLLLILTLIDIISNAIWRIITSTTQAARFQYYTKIMLGQS